MHIRSCAGRQAPALMLTLALLCGLGTGLPAQAQPMSPASTASAASPSVPGYLLGAGDQLRISVYQSPDLSFEARLADTGTINFPLLGPIRLAGLTVPQAEAQLSEALRAAGLVRNPQVMLLLTQPRSNQITVLGVVGRPGRYPLDVAGMRLTELLALAGGTGEASADTLVLLRRNGQAEQAQRLEIHLPSLFAAEQATADPVLQPGDVIWVDRAPQIFFQGEVTRPGPVRLLRNMTLRQALATAGGVTLRGTLKGFQIHRRGAGKDMQVLVEPSLDESPRDGDVIVIRESLF